VKFIQGIKTMFGYDAIVDKGRRRSPATGKKHEGYVLPPKDAKKLQGTIYDLVRNDPSANWAFNKYLDYSTNFHFQVDTPDMALNEAVEQAMDDWSKKQNCDITGRDNLKFIIRNWGSGIALDGDSLLAKIRGYKLQGIEADRITNDNISGDVPEYIRKLKTKDGLITDRYGKVLKFIICNRVNNTTRMEYATTYKYDDVVFDGTFFRFDQRRGISQFSNALNIYQDIGEIDEAQLIKCKKHAMFGVAIMSDGTESGFNENNIYDTDNDGEEDVEESSQTSGPKYDFDIDMGLKLELSQGDKIDMFESSTPSQEYKEYSELMLRKGFLAFYVPYSFFDSRGSSYSSMRQDRAEFKMSIAPARVRTKNALNDITDWVMPYLKREYNLNIPDNFKEYEWIPEGEVYLDEGKEVDAAVKRISTGLSDLPLEHKKLGSNFYKSQKRQANAMQAIDGEKILLWTANGQPISPDANVSGGKNAKVAE
jgi:capsid protein